jgi:hypothetical protein
VRAIVVYESLWGNTEKLARAVASGLGLTMSVELVDTDAAPATVEGYDLVVVGGPTHAFSMSRPSTREQGVDEKGAPHAPGRGIREWLDALPPSTAHTPAAAFDTKVESPRLPGSAAKAALKELTSRGFETPMAPRTFRVHGYEGPIVDGELDAAAAWGRELADVTAVVA